jgi:hypothetical protein
MAIADGPFARLEGAACNLSAPPDMCEESSFTRAPSVSASSRSTRLPRRASEARARRFDDRLDRRRALFEPSRRVVDEQDAVRHGDADDHEDAHERGDREALSGGRAARSVLQNANQSSDSSRSSMR